MQTYASGLRHDHHEPALERVAPGYRGYVAWHRLFAELEREGAQVRVLGESVEHRPIFGLEWGDPDADSVGVLISGVHAMEWVGIEVGYAIVRSMWARFPGRRMLYIPLLNPDGFRRAERDLVEGRRRFVRANARGVDLNRGWPTHYRSFHGPSKLLPFLGNSGGGARTEPEIDAACSALDELVQRGLRVEQALSMHSFGKVILRPWGGVFARTKDEEDLLESSRLIAERSLGGYRPKQVSRWYPGISFAHGMELDHLYGAYASKALLIECSAGGFRWADPSSWFHPWRWFNPPDPQACAAELSATLADFLAGALVRTAS